MIHFPENIIIQKVKAGDFTAFRQLYHIYFQRLFLFAQKFVSAEQAKDVVQDCFYNFWVNRQKIEITSSVSAYLFTIIKNSCYKLLKEEQRKTVGEQNFWLKLKQEELQYFINSEKSIFEFDVKDRIGKVMKHLPEKCAEVFNESRFNGLSNKEIAMKFNISEKAIEKHISKALKLFRDEFKDIITVWVTLLAQNIF
jgi:RNA polymerase sigma-70 factor (ECF subfamily)